MIEELRLAYTAIQTRPAPPAGDVSVVPVGAGGHWAGIDDQRRLHLLVRRPDGDTEIPESLDVVNIAARQLVVAGLRHNTIDVTSLSPALGEVFEQFAAAVLEQMDRNKSGSPSAVLGSVLAAWRRFLQHTPGGAPGRSRLAGLFGELLVLLDLTRISPAAGVSVWAGADQARHDFRAAGHAVEVKTTLGSGNTVTVHGLGQLDPPESGTLHVHLVQLEAVAGAGRSVADLVDALLAAGAPPNDLYLALADAGLPADQVAATRPTTFEVIRRSTLPVGDGFPRLTAASFVQGQPPPGVTGVTYQADLSHQLAHAVSDTAWARLTAALAAGTQ